MTKTTRPPGRTIWASVEGVIVPGSVLTGSDGVSALIRAADGSETRVLAYGAPQVAMITEASGTDRPVILQGVLTGSEGEGGRHLLVRVLGPLTLTGEVTETDRSGEGAEPRVSFWMRREVSSDQEGIRLVGTGVNVHGPDAEAIAGLRVGDRVTLQARHGPDGFIATSPVTLLPDPDGDERGA